MQTLRFVTTAFWFLAVAALLGVVPSTASPQRAADTLPAQISDAEFWRMVSEFSEPSGDYPYDNWISNEDTVQTVIPTLKQIVKPGGVFIGVAPEQNFTYISALQSRLAFVVDIRRQNLLEHLMFKALFELAPDRADFVSLLFSRKRPGGLDDKASPAALFAAYRTSEKANFPENLQSIRATLSKHGFQLSEEDLLTIDLIYQVFYRGGPSITSEFMASGTPTTGTPSFSQLMTGNDGQGRNWSFLATEEAFQHVREMQRKNLIVPVVGDFGGMTALRKIGQYLKDYNAPVGAFYISNVERYLVGVGRPPDSQSPQLQNFYRNVANLPIDSSSTFIRLLGGNSPKPSWSRANVVQVVSPMADLVNLVNLGQAPSYATAIEIIKEPTLLGSAVTSASRKVTGRIVPTNVSMPRFSVPVSLGPGRPFSSIAINPATDGTFIADVPVGVLQAGAPVGLPTGVSIKSLLYGNVDLLKDSVTVAPTDALELRITLGP